ncbi:MAG: type II toxin-antitoxin system RelE/ParE family toxin, partial [Synergistales bacterium]|nr:type II toxin-antitoxin system RelE/ParE family toxin [Synergistales bacterium]
YVTRKGERVVILRFFDKKTQKTPKKEIDLAEDRLKQRQKESTDPRRRL